MAAKFEMTLCELLSKYKLSEEFLKEKCSDEHINQMAEKLEDWEKVAPSLGVNADDVKVNSGSDSSLRRIKCLQKWKKQSGYKATYNSLLEVLLMQPVRSVNF